jgi:hypothetical protein
VDFGDAPKAVRQEILLENLVLVDGQPGCGKTLFTAIIAAMERVELLNYSFELENLCGLRYLDKIDQDAVEAMIRIQMDLVLYETMMGRRVNVRPKDLSSIFRDTEWFRYLKRMLSEGDKTIPEKIRKEKPILHFATHNLLGFSRPIFDALPTQAFIVEIIRHPLYMLIQQTLNQESFNAPGGSVRQPHLYIQHGKNQVPYWNFGQEDLVLESNSVERAIYEIKRIQDITNDVKNYTLKPYLDRVYTIPFEQFVLKPVPFLVELEEKLGTRITSKTRKIIRSQNIPRKKIADGIPLAIYQRCGWRPPVAGLSEKEELKVRRDFAVEGNVSADALRLLDDMSAQYEAENMKGII